MKIANVLDEAPHAKPWLEEGPLGISDIQFSPDNKRLFWHGQYGKEDFRATSALNTGNGFKIAENTIAKFKEPLAINHVLGCVAGASDTLYCGTSSGLRMYDGKSGKPGGEINLSEAQAGQVQYVVSPDGAWVASADEEGQVNVWDMTFLKRPCHVFSAHKGPVVGLSFSADGHWLATAGEENRVHLWKLTELQDRRPGHDKARVGKR
jgi:WD40 repeat protein